MTDAEVDALIAEIERLHHQFTAMARSYREYAVQGGKYLGPDDCAEFSRYFDGKAAFLARLLDEATAAPPAAPAKPRLVRNNGEPV